MNELVKSNLYLIHMDNELYHHGIKGMKWGVRRYQNPDGTLTEAGKKRKQKSDIKAFNRKAHMLTARGQAVELAGREVDRLTPGSKTKIPAFIAGAWYPHKTPPNYNVAVQAYDDLKKMYKKEAVSLKKEENRMIAEHGKKVIKKLKYRKVPSKYLDERIETSKGYTGSEILAALMFGPYIPTMKYTDPGYPNKLIAPHLYEKARAQYEEVYRKNYEDQLNKR